MKKEEKINKIFTKLELSQINLFLSRGDLPLKYVYKTEKGSKAWVVLENVSSKGYKPYSLYDSDLLLKNELVYLDEINNNENNKEIVVFDFGPGEGRPVEKFLKKLSKNRKVFYHAFDISQFILEKNKKRIEKISKNISYNSDIVDFESGNFFEIVMKAKERYDNQNILGLFLGNTVGNFTSIKNIIQKILEPFSIDDRLIIGIARSKLKNRLWIEETTDSYKSSEVREFVISVIELLGLKPKDYIYNAEFNQKETAIDLSVTFKKDIKIKINKKEILFKKGQKIRIAKSEKVDEVKMTKIFSDLNIRVSNMRSSEDDKYIQFCLSNKNFY